MRLICAVIAAVIAVAVLLGFDFDVIKGIAIAILLLAVGLVVDDVRARL